MVEDVEDLVEEDGVKMIGADVREEPPIQSCPIRNPRGGKLNDDDSRGGELNNDGLNDGDLLNDVLDGGLNGDGNDGRDNVFFDDVLDGGLNGDGNDGRDNVFFNDDTFVSKRRGIDNSASDAHSFDSISA